MAGFRTNNSEYLVDIQNKTIMGGIFGRIPASYVQLVAVIGAYGYIRLANGQEVRTSKISAYI